MRRFVPFFIILFLSGLPLLSGAEYNSSSVRIETNFSIRSSVDRGSSYLGNWCVHPSVLAFVNSDGSVTVCTSDESKKTTYIYEFTINLQEKKRFSIPNEMDQLGAFTKDAAGNYYFFFGSKAASKSSQNMAMVKYSADGKKQNTFKLDANPANSFSGIQIPFDAGTCRLELSGSMLAVYFARQMFDGHQASYGFVLNKDTFARIDRGAATHPDVGGNTQMPYVSHSFNQFILPVDNGFVFADHGDAYPRSFTFGKLINGSNTKRLHAFTFPGKVGDNATFSELGGLAKLQSGYIFAGIYAKDKNTARNLFVLTIDENLNTCSAPIYITRYASPNGHAGHPKIVRLDAGRFLLMWELFVPSTGFASVYTAIVNETGAVQGGIQELKNARLNMNDVLRYNPVNKKVYWAINDTSNSITVYSMDTVPGAAAPQTAAPQATTPQTTAPKETAPKETPPANSGTNNDQKAKWPFTSSGKLW